MAARIARLAQLTLYSGPQCSLCDVSLDGGPTPCPHPCPCTQALCALSGGEGRARESQSEGALLLSYKPEDAYWRLVLQRTFDLKVVNIQDPGQERWKRKYVYWIPALHLEGQEVAKGRWDATDVEKALDTWEKDAPTEEAAVSAPEK
jgi:hypothetical protein